MSKLKYFAGHVATTHDENPAGGGRLNMTGILFLGQCRKPLVLRLQMTETKLITLLQNPHGTLQKKGMGKACLFISNFGPIVNIPCRLVTNPVI